MSVNAYEEYEVRYWCDAFGCTKAEFVDCVNRVGVMADSVRKCIGQRKGRR